MRETYRQTDIQTEKRQRQTAETQEREREREREMRERERERETEREYLLQRISSDLSAQSTRKSHTRVIGMISPELQLNSGKETSETVMCFGVEKLLREQG